MPVDRAGNYAVGYCKPPLHTRFKKGQSGNPRGRPRGPKTLTGLLLQALDRRVVVDEDGRRRKIAKRELGAEQLADKFVKGDPHAIRTVLNLVLEIERRTQPEPAERPSLEMADRKVIENLLALFRTP